MMQSFKKHLRTRAMVTSIYFIALLLTVVSVLQIWNYQIIAHAEEEQKVLTSAKVHYQVVWEKISMSDLGVRAFLAVNEPKMLGPHKIAMDSYKTDFDGLEEALKNLLIYVDFDVSEELRVYREQYEAKMKEANQVIELCHNGRFEEAKDIVRKDTGEKLFYDYYKPLRVKLYKHLNEHLMEANEAKRASILRINLVQGLLFLLALPALLAVAFQLRKARQERSELYKSLDDSNRQLIFDDGREKSAETQEKAVFNNIMGNLERTAHFIKEITEGRYDIRWEGLSSKLDMNKDNIAGRLVQMRDKMKAVREKDQLRIWSTEGHALFAEITRRHRDSSTEMYAELVSQLVKYLRINQAGLFVLNQENGNGEEKEFLELAACYAFDRRKYLQSKIFPGDGLVGQVFLEGESVNLREVPDNYIQITSGLGDASPRALLLVPVKYNSQVVGILELASFKPFDENVVKFVEEVGNILGATLIANQTNAVTQKLLKTTQEQAEELRLQEEEMRQNMEELEATQEEMRRQHCELESENQVLKQEKAALQQSATDERALTK